MGKIKTKGTSEKVFTADRCRITLSLETQMQTSDIASKKMSEELEKLLEKLKGMEINPEQIELFSDKIKQTSHYNSKEAGYISEREISFCIPAETKNVNAIRELIESGFENVALTVEYFLSNEKEYVDSLLKEAISDSKSKAELIAKTIGMQVVGIDAANFSDDDFLDITDEPEFIEMVRRKNAPSLSDLLKPEQITVSKDVTIIWTVE